MASGIESGRRSRSIHSRKSLTTGHGRANTRMLPTFLVEFSVTGWRSGSDCPERCTVEDAVANVSSVGVLEFVHVPGHPTASERSLGGTRPTTVCSSYLVARCRQERRMKDNILIEGSYRSGKIASFQRGREDSRTVTGNSPVVGQVKASACQLLADLSLPDGISSTTASWRPRINMAPKVRVARHETGTPCNGHFSLEASAASGGC